jgi:hypothetical protein
MAVLHKAEADMTEADVVKDIVAVLAQVRQGVEVVVCRITAPSPSSSRRRRNQWAG